MPKEEEAQDPVEEEVDANAEGGFSTQMVSKDEPSPEQEDGSVAKPTDQAEQRSPEQIKFDTKFQSLHGQEQAARKVAEDRTKELEAQLAQYDGYSDQDRAFVEKRRELARRDPELHDQLLGELDPSLTSKGQTADARTQAMIQAELAPIKQKQNEQEAETWARGVVRKDEQTLLEAGFDHKDEANKDAKVVLKAMTIQKVGGIDNMTDMYKTNRIIIDKLSGATKAKAEMQKRIGQTVATAKGSDHIPNVTNGRSASFKEAMEEAKADWLKEIADKE